MLMSVDDSSVWLNVGGDFKTSSFKLQFNYHLFYKILRL